MKNIRPIVYQELSTDADLLALLGGDYVYYMIAPDSAELPRITFLEYLNVDSTFADNSPETTNIGFQMDVWNAGDVMEIAKAVDKVMKRIGFSRSYAIEEFDEEVRLNRFVMRYSTQVELEEDEK